MKQCPVLEYVEMMAQTMDDYLHNRIGIKVYESRVNDLRRKIDKSVIDSCWLPRIEEVQDGDRELVEG